VLKSTVELMNNSKNKLNSKIIFICHQHPNAHTVYVSARLTICLLILGLQKLFIEGKTMENAALPYYKILKLVNMNMIDIFIFQNLNLSAISSFVARLVRHNMF